MAKVFGYVVLNAEGKKNMGIGAGPFPIIDTDHHFGVEILDHQKRSHWIMKGQYTELDQNTITIDADTYKKSCGQFIHVQGVLGALDVIRQLIEVQGRDGNWNHSEGMTGMFNGMELILAVLENRDPVYRTLNNLE
jgi:hypothetical protein